MLSQGSTLNGKRGVMKVDHQFQGHSIPVFRPFATLLLLPLIASCTLPDIVAAATFIGDELAFVAADPGDADTESCWTQAAIIDDALVPVWEFSERRRSEECGRIFPLFFGQAPAEALATTPPQPLRPGRLYLLIGHATHNVYGAFALIRAGDRSIIHNVDPDSFPASELRRRWQERNQGDDDANRAGAVIAEPPS